MIRIPSIRLISMGIWIGRRWSPKMLAHEPPTYRRVIEANIASRNNPHIAPEHLCTDYSTASRFNFAGSNFTRGIAFRGDLGINSKSTYDVDSVTHYVSCVAGQPNSGCVEGRFPGKSLIGFWRGLEGPWMGWYTSGTLLGSRGGMRSGLGCILGGRRGD
ncbi:hypothetical protein BCR34DRAFT_662602 [Clohesyomyces aquaticus]|uniref:Uncharacterized protein n=1 Tax=Clohesyomyces aquaticus TaxID=1231657 RepID=A0A1Y1ZWE4_9PLEO|nr:hypothetical protein BCR34DRAFT_662602 [Clohesyomyces aquaticus]